MGSTISVRFAKSISGRLGEWSWPLAALFAMNLLNYTDRYILAAVLKTVKSPTQLNFNDTQAGLLATVFFISYALFSPAIGWYGDRVARRKLLAIGVGIWSVATFGSAWATSYWQLLLARSVLGIGEATYAILAPTLIADLVPPQKHSGALSRFNAAIPIGAALGYLLGGIIDTYFGWRVAFQVVGWPGLLVAFSALFLREPKRGASRQLGEHGSQEGEIDGVDSASAVHSESLPSKSTTYKQLLGNRPYLYNLLAMAMFTFALGGLQWWTAVFLADSRGIPQLTVDIWLFVTVTVSGIVGTLAGGWIGDRLVPTKGREAYFRICSVSVLVALPFIALALAPVHPIVIFAGILIGVTLASLNYGPSNAIIASVSPPTMLAAAFAVNTFAIHLLGDIPSPWLMGAVSSATGNRFWGMVITLPALALSGLFFYIGKRSLQTDENKCDPALIGHDVAEAAAEALDEKSY